MEDLKLTSLKFHDMVIKLRNLSDRNCTFIRVISSCFDNRTIHKFTIIKNHF